jgi:aspartate/methionine/tyrosine aminotransferase
MNGIYAERRIWAEKIMDLLECHYDKQQVGLFVWGKLKDEAPDSEAVVNDLLHNARVFITPGSIFGSNGTCFIRISLGSSIEKMKEAYERILEYKN